jgi:hypothetical protein
VTFLDLNGYDVEAEMTDALQAVLALAAGTLGEEAFAAWLAAHGCARSAGDSDECQPSSRFPIVIYAPPRT